MMLFSSGRCTRFAANQRQQLCLLGHFHEAPSHGLGSQLRLRHAFICMPCLLAFRR